MQGRCKARVLDVVLNRAPLETTTVKHQNHDIQPAEEKLCRQAQSRCPSVQVLQGSST
jgi:hypothetical protein